MEDYLFIFFCFLQRLSFLHSVPQKHWHENYFSINEGARESEGKKIGKRKNIVIFHEEK